MGNSRLFLIDGSGYIFRAFYAVRPLTRSDKLPTNAVYGFTKMMIKLRQKMLTPNDYVAVVFDSGRVTFRNDIYREYKANRVETPPDLIPQFSYIRKSVEALNMISLEQQGFEADDIIASLAINAKKQGIEVVVVSADKDLMQLMSNGISIYDSLKEKTITEADVLEKFGVEPEKVRDVQALMGDSSDNIPGIKGVGPKTASQLINEFGSLENLLNNAENIKNEKLKQKVISEADMARISMQLVSLRHDVIIEKSIEDMKVKELSLNEIKTFLEEMEFKQLIKQLEDSSNRLELKDTTNIELSIPNTKNIEAKYKNITKIDDWKNYFEIIKNSKKFAIDTETDSIDALKANLIGISLSTKEGEGVYIPISHKSYESNLFNIAEKEEKLSIEELKDDINFLTKSKEHVKIGHNIKYDIHVLNKYGIFFNNIEDTMVMAFSLFGNKIPTNMDDLAKHYLNHSTIKFTDIVPKGKTFADVSLEIATNYAAEDADITLRLYNLFSKTLESSKRLSVYKNLDMPLVEVLKDMEDAGIKVDKKALSDLSIFFNTQIEKLTQDIFKETGKEFNIASPKQLGEILFDNTEIKGKKNKKSGSWKTDNDVLEKLAEDGNTTAKLVLEFRSYSKLKNTYTDSLVESIYTKTGRVHTSFAQNLVNTGRLSSSNPNLQNIPIRKIEGKKIRAAFIAQDGFKFIGLDYSQIELRLLAHVADINSLKRAFANGIDIHSQTASEVFDIPLNEVTADYRRQAKAINFGIIYGISQYGLARQLNITKDSAKIYIEKYFRKFPGILEYMEKTKDFAHQNGYVETFMNRYCNIGDINSSNGAVRGFAERTAINAPIQGGAADIMRLAMIKVHKFLKTTDAKMLLQVHDELIIEAKNDIAETIFPKIKDIMENIVELSVPLVVDGKIGNNWDEIH